MLGGPALAARLRLAARMAPATEHRHGRPRTTKRSDAEVRMDTEDRDGSNPGEVDLPREKPIPLVLRRVEP